MPGLRASPASMDAGWSLRNVTRQSGSPVISTSKCSPSGPKRQGGSRCSSPMSQLTAAVTTGLAVDQALPLEALGRHPARGDRPDGRVDGRGGHRHLVRGAQGGVEIEPELVGHHVHRLAEAAAQRLGHDALARLLGGLAEEHPVADDVGSAVGADVGELLGPHAGDGARQGRDHQREALGDPAGVDTRAVQGDAGTPAHRVELGPLLAGRVEPAERRDQVLARLEDAGRPRRRRRRSGCTPRSRPRGRAARRHPRWPRSPSGIAADEGAHVHPVLGLAVHPAPGQLEIGMGQHPFHGGPAHVARGPLDHSVRHCSTPTGRRRGPP